MSLHILQVKFNDIAHIQYITMNKYIVKEATSWHSINFYKLQIILIILTFIIRIQKHVLLTSG